MTPYHTSYARFSEKMSSNTLKIIAITAMLTDHIAWAFVPSRSLLGQLMHIIGRLTAPIMCFLIAEGYHHTSNVKNMPCAWLFLPLSPMHPISILKQAGCPSIMKMV